MNKLLQTSPLDEDNRDRVVTSVRAGVNLIPLVGGTLAELIASQIAGQRIDRVTDVVTRLQERIGHVEGWIDQILERGLAEPLLLSAMLAQTDQHRDRLARIAAFGFNSDKEKDTITRRVIELAARIEDDHMVVLVSCTRSYNDREWWSRHEDIVHYPHVRTVVAPYALVEGKAQHDLRYLHIEGLGLIAPLYHSTVFDRAPEFDSATGKLKQHGWKITEIAEVLFKYLGLNPGFVYQQE